MFDGIDPGTIAGWLFLGSLAAGALWKVGTWLKDLKDGQDKTNEYLRDLNSKTVLNATGLTALEMESREQFAWLCAKVGEPLPQRRL